MKIEYPDLFSYDLCITYLQRSPREVLHRIDNNAVFKALYVDGDTVIFKISPGRNELNVEFPGHGRGDKNIEEVVRQYIREWFDMGTDLSPFYKLAKKDDLLGPLIKQFRGYRIVGQPDLFESLVWAVLGQQINLAFAYTLKQRFVTQFGTTAVADGITYYLFPEPAIVAGLTDGDLLPLQFSRQKSKYVTLIGEAFSSGTISKEKLSQLPFEEAKAALMKIKGIGNWTANYGLMKTFRYPNAFPLEDAGLHNAIRNLKKMKKKPSLNQVKKIFKNYRGWEAYATLYLWRSL